MGLGNKSNKIVPRHWNSGAQSNCSVFVTSYYVIKLRLQGEPLPQITLLESWDLDGVISRASERLGFSIVRPNQRKSINTGKSFAFPSWILIHNPWVERLKSTLGILMWFVVSTVIAYHIGILDQNPMLGTRNFSLCKAFLEGNDVFVSLPTGGCDAAN